LDRFLRGLYEAVEDQHRRKSKRRTANQEIALPVGSSACRTHTDKRHWNRAVSKGTANTLFVTGERALILSLTETERVLGGAQRTEDLLAIDSLIPFERVKLEVLEMGLTMSKMLIGRSNSPESAVLTDSDWIIRHEKWLDEHKALREKVGPQIFISTMEL